LGGMEKEQIGIATYRERKFVAGIVKFLRHLVGITKLDKEKNQCIREKTETQNIIKEIKQYQKK
jgi:predicted Rossmann-fold nucleotide-binding protein